MCLANFLTQLRFNSLPTYSAKKSSRLTLFARAKRNNLPSSPISNWSRLVNCSKISATRSSFRRILLTCSNSSKRILLYFFSSAISGASDDNRFSKRFACNFCIPLNIRFIFANRSVTIGIKDSSITGIGTPDVLRGVSSFLIPSSSSASSSSSSSSTDASAKSSKSSSSKSSTCSTPLDFNASDNAANDFCSDSLEYITSRFTI